MIAIRRCDEVSAEQIYEAFKEGFSDYIIQTTIGKDDFLKIFFGAEGNSLATSFLAFDQNKPVGLVLGGIRLYDHTLTMRCGALCVHPEYRRQGISSALMKHHEQAARLHACKQLYLEVIAGNEPALAFYEKWGYCRMYDLRYFTLREAQAWAADKQNKNCQELDLAQAWDFFNNSQHCNWQNSLESLKQIAGLKAYGVYEKTELAGMVIVQERGRIFHLTTAMQHRHQGIARSLLAHVISVHQPTQLQIAFANNASLEGFIRKMGFDADKLAQYELYRPLKENEHA